MQSCEAVALAQEVGLLTSTWKTRIRSLALSGSPDPARAIAGIWESGILPTRLGRTLEAEITLSTREFADTRAPVRARHNTLQAHTAALSSEAQGSNSLGHLYSEHRPEDSRAELEADGLGDAPIQGPRQLVAEGPA